MKKKALLFNPYQRAVIDFRRGYAVCMAAPGSGKTAVITERILALLREGVRPQEILSLTFTKEGAKEMTARAGLKDVEYKLFSTFHSWALAFLKREHRALPFAIHMKGSEPDFLCLPITQSRTIAGIVRRIPGIEWKEAASYIGVMKRRGLSPNQAADLAESERDEAFAEAYRKYDAALHEKGLLDFDSVVIETAKLLERREDVRARNQFKYVQVDEAQDTDSVQWRIVAAVSEFHGNALAVGDENQGMYSWRGSESNLTEYFTGKFPSAKVFPLPVNYRSTQSIVSYCKDIAPIKNETVTNLSTPNDKGQEPDFVYFIREDEEAKYVVNSITDLGNTAVLARTNRQLAAFEDECSNRNVRYKLLGKSGFWSQNEVKDLVACVACVVAPSDNAVLRMLTCRSELTKFIRKHDTHADLSTPNHLKRLQAQQVDQAGGAPVPIHRLLTSYRSGDNQEELVRMIGHTLHSLRGETAMLSGKDAVRRIVDRFGLLSVYDADMEDEEDSKHFDNDPRENILKLMEYAAKRATLKDFYDYTQRVRRASLARTDCLILSTIHQAKGKEWKNVFVAGVNEDVLPHKKGEESEEARIYFVACSRAAQRLVVSANGLPSKFIKDKLPKGKAAEVPQTTDVWAGFQLQA